MTPHTDLQARSDGAGVRRPAPTPPLRPPAVPRDARHLAADAATALAHSGACSAEDEWPGRQL